MTPEKKKQIAGDARADVNKVSKDTEIGLRWAREGGYIEGATAEANKAEVLVGIIQKFVKDCENVSPSQLKFLGLNDTYSDFKKALEQYNK